MVKLKVLLATYNGENYVQEQIDSILQQKDVEVDLMVCDDGSKDKTLQIISKNYPFIFIMENKPGTGSAAKNFLKMVINLNYDEDFDYVSFADQDDIWLPPKLKSAVDLLQRNNADLYSSNMTKWDTQTGNFSLLKKDFPQKEFDFLFEGASAGCTYVFTKRFAEAFKVFLINLDSNNWKNFSHDWLTYWFARTRNFNVIIDSKSYIHYRIHDTNVHGHLNKLSLNTIKEKTLEVLNGYYQSHAKNYIKHLDEESESYIIYQQFLKSYFTRNRIIWKYNTKLMRDNKKFIIFALLNLLKFK